MTTIRGVPGQLHDALAFTMSQAVTTDAFYPAAGNTHVTFSVKATRAGTWITYGYTQDGDAVALHSARSVSANTADAYTTESCFAYYKIIFTEGGVGAGTLNARVVGCNVQKTWTVAS